MKNIINLSPAVFPDRNYHVEQAFDLGSLGTLPVTTQLNLLRRKSEDLFLAGEIDNCHLMRIVDYFDWVVRGVFPTLEARQRTTVRKDNTDTRLFSVITRFWEFKRFETKFLDTKEVLTLEAYMFQLNYDLCAEDEWKRMFYEGAKSQGIDCVVMPNKSVAESQVNRMVCNLYDLVATNGGYIRLHKEVETGQVIVKATMPFGGDIGCVFMITFEGDVLGTE